MYLPLSYRGKLSKAVCHYGDDACAVTSQQWSKELIADDGGRKKKLISQIGISAARRSAGPRSAGGI